MTMPDFENQEEYIANTRFSSEKIPPPAAKMRKASLPPLLREARRLEKATSHLSSQARFMQEGTLLAEYEDDFEFAGAPLWFYPTYELLQDDALRGYFSWRTKFRNEETPDVPLSFLHLYCYELINNIGVADPHEGLERLVELREAYGLDDSEVDADLGAWIIDYIVYYNLDPAFLSECNTVKTNRYIDTLANISKIPDSELLEAVKYLAHKWLGRSKFYSVHHEMMDVAIIAVLKGMAEHYDKKCKNTLVEQIYGHIVSAPATLFAGAIFCDPLNRQEFHYPIDNHCGYKCENGRWSKYFRPHIAQNHRKLDNLFKAIDGMMRPLLQFGHPIKAPVLPKWLVGLIAKELERVISLNQKKERQKVKIDLGRLNQIRKDADSTRDKLITPEEEIQEDPVFLPLATEYLPEETPTLTENEMRLLHALLYAEDLGWIRAEGHLLSVLVDGINDKLYEIFQDSVLNDTPEIVEDYIEQLKEICPQ